MKLIILSISSIDTLKLEDYLLKEPLNYLKVASVGGIINNGVVTYLIKIIDEQKREVVRNIRNLCKTRKVKCENVHYVEDLSLSLYEREQFTGGGSMLILPLEEYIKV